MPEIGEVMLGMKNVPGSGPHGLGLPDDLTLRRCDIVYAVPVAIREIIEREACYKEHNAYMACRDEHYWTKFVTCRNHKQVRKNCIKNHWYDEGLHERGKQEYIEERAIYRETGIRRRDRMNPSFTKPRPFVAIRSEEDMPKERLSFLQAIKLAWSSAASDK